MPSLRNSLGPALLAAVMLTGCGGGAVPATQAPSAPAKYRIKVGAAEALVRVAATPEERAKGLSGDVTLGPDEGMLFIFPSPQTPSFWMKDTRIALSIAFITPACRISDIMEMAPETLDAHTPREPALMALEMPSGWFAAKGVKPGDTVACPPELFRETLVK